MSRIFRPLGLLIAAQAICLAIGFWFQYQLVTSTIDREVNESVWSDLAAQSEPLIERVRNRAGNSVDWSTIQDFLLDRTSTEDGPLPEYLLTDGQGKILGFNKSGANHKWRRGERINWKQDHAVVSSDESHIGFIVTSQGDRAAVSYPLKNQDRQLVAYIATPMAPSWRKSLVTAFAQSSGLGFFWTLSLSGVAFCLLMSRFNVQAMQQKAELDHEALKNAQDLLRTRDAVIFGLAKLAESRDPETGHHLERISLYSTRLATAMRAYPKYQRTVTPTFVRLLGISSVLHDIGKVGVEDTVLLKPGRLNETERQRMQQHTLVAGDCLKEIEERLGASNFLQTAREIALHHHERWDGSGYPYGLSGEEIPLAARIVAVCDVYDALRSKRVYKEAYSHDDCVREIRNGAGTQFDPALVDVLLEIEPEFAAISRRFFPGASEAAQQNSTGDSVRTGDHANDAEPELFNSSNSSQLPVGGTHAVGSVA